MAAQVQKKPRTYRKRNHRLMIFLVLVLILGGVALGYFAGRDSQESQTEELSQPEQQPSAPEELEQPEPQPSAPEEPEQPEPQSPIPDEPEQPEAQPPESEEPEQTEPQPPVPEESEQPEAQPPEPEKTEQPNPPAEPTEPEFSTLPQEPAEPDDTAWNLRLVNKHHPLPEGYQIPKLTKLANGHAVDARAYPELQQMMDDCRAAGHQPLICSSYRPHETQVRLFNNKMDRLLAAGCDPAEVEERAAEWVAVPGTSEHEGGLALDIVDVSYQMLDDAQENTPAQQWLMAHCQEYGFILRYPKDKTAITEIGYEPWHYRYVGKEAAQEIMSAGICLEEYLELE